MSSRPLLEHTQLLFTQFWIKGAYVLLNAVLAGGIVVQIFLAGVYAFGVHPTWIAYHIKLGHGLGAGLMLLLGLAWWARLPRRIWMLNALLILIFGLQYNARALALALDLPALTALHAVNALVLFLGVTTLFRWSRDVVRVDLQQAE